MKFSTAYPSHQNAIDLVPEWTSAMPSGSGLTAGSLAHFTDTRVTWAASQLGGLAGKTILEVGPFEAYNTYQFDQLGAAGVLSIESSESNFLRCLIVKNIFSLRATFMLGDGIKYLEGANSHFDICWLSGLLYHMIEPVRLLRAASQVSDILFIWTQYYDESVISAEPGQQAHFDRSLNRTMAISGSQITLHHRNYSQTKAAGFSGGSDECSYWMSKDDIFLILESLGYGTIIMGIDNPRHPAGPACFFLALRSKAG